VATQPLTVPPAGRPADLTRPEAVHRARVLNRVTIGWNVVEGVVALAAGVAAGSVSLIGFGLDSGIEVSASAILAWRLHRERRGGCMAEDDRRATRAIAISFLALAAYVWFEGTRDLIEGAHPEVSVVGLVLVTVSLVVMPFLAVSKGRLAPALGSRAAASEANQTMLCALLSGIVLLGLGLNALAGWWWADPVAGMVIGVIAAAEAVRAWRAEALEDTCCA
jgi:divalent metal cation (Fe/Co/Zn/Cd) transporter